LSARADYLLAFAAAPGARTFGEVVVLCIPRETAGVAVTDTWSQVMGMRATVSWSTTFDNIFVPWDDVIGVPGAFIRDPRGWTLAYSANFLGTAQGVYNFIIDYVKKKPHLIEDDVVAYTIGSMESALQASRTSLWYACWLWEKKDFQAAELASLRFNHVAREAALEITNKAFEICGASAAFRTYPLDRALRDTRTFTLHTRESANMRLLAHATVKGEFHAKQWFASAADQLTWADFGVTPPAGHS
jgi:alkylation response protein AidB-like acyl-CoA dehydrogenase